MSAGKLILTDGLREDFPSGTVDGDYLDRVLRVFGEVDLPQSVDSGVAMMEILVEGQITLRSGEKLPDSASFIPSTIEIATIVATALSSVSADPYWWRERLFDGDREHEINVAKADLAQMLRESPEVESVSGV